VSTLRLCGRVPNECVSPLALAVRAYISTAPCDMPRGFDRSKARTLDTIGVDFLAGHLYVIPAGAATG